MKKNLFLKKILVIMIIFSFSVVAANAKNLKIDTIDVAPFGFLDKDGKPTGMMYEISNRIAEEAGMQYSNDIVPYPRTILDLESGSADFVLRFNNEKLPQIAVPVISIIAMPTIVVGKSSTNFKSLEDLHGKTVGLLRGGKFDDKFDADTAIKKYDAKDYEQILKMIMVDHLDAGIGSNVGLYYSASKAGIKQADLGQPLVLSSKDFILHFSKKTADQKTMDALKAAVERLQKQDEIKKIINKYMGDYKWEVESAAK